MGGGVHAQNVISIGRQSGRNAGDAVGNESGGQFHALNSRFTACTADANSTFNSK